MNSIIDWLEVSGFRIVVIMLVVWAVRRSGNLVIRRAIRRSIRSDNYATELDKERRQKTLESMITNTARVFLWLVASMLIIQEFGVDIGPLLAGASILGVALGFGAQSLVKDFISGVFIIMENQYRVGDVVTLAGATGVVEGITVRTTILRDLDGHVHHIPNGIIDVATNQTMDFSRINMDIGVDYSTNVKKVEKIIDDTGIELMNDPEWSNVIIEAPHFIRVESFGTYAVVIKILGKVSPGSQWSVGGELRQRLLKAFSKNHIDIPLLQSVAYEGKKSK